MQSGCLRLALTLCWVLALPVAAQDAFVGAVGQGAAASGGRGGEVYRVTNLGDYAEGETAISGSLRDGIESATGPRTIVFAVGGVLPLVRPLRIDTSNLTIAGQTAPGGITLYGYYAVVEHASDVVVRYMRFRTGDFNAAPARGLPGRGKMDLLGDDADAVSIGVDTDRIIFDHVSASWSMDEVFSMNSREGQGATDIRNVTVQRSIIGESLNRSLHTTETTHGYGSLVRGDLSDAEQVEGSGGYTFYGNLFVSNSARNPAFGGQQHPDAGQDFGDPATPRRDVDVNFINNVIYNWSAEPTHRVPDGEVRVNYVGNYIIAGPDTPDDRADLVADETDEGQTWLYLDGNLVDADKDGILDGVPLATTSFENFEISSSAGSEVFGGGSLDGIPDGTPFDFSRSVAASVMTASEAYEDVVAGVGASLDPDANDLRCIRELLSLGTQGKILDSQEQLRVNGVLPGIDGVDVEVDLEPDTDRDGLPDAFEREFGLNPLVADQNGRDLSADGYTNLEVYLGVIAGDIDRNTIIPVPEPRDAAAVAVATLLWLRRRML